MCWLARMVSLKELGADAVIMGFPDSRKLLNRLSALILSTPTSFGLPLRPLPSYL